MIVKRIGVWSLAKIAGLVYGGMGLIFAGIIGLLSLLQLAGGVMGFHIYDVGFQCAGVMGSLLGRLPVPGAVLLAPPLYALMGLVGGALAALIYNLVARLVGGLQVELE